VVTVEQLREVLSYDKDTGEFYWKKKVANRVSIGDLTGRMQRGGYLLICIKNKRYLAHRLAWLYVYGKWPINQLDHINGIRSDNRICNLRDATRCNNAQNKKVQANNKLGVKGVEFHACGKYRSTIWKDNKRYHLGLFDSVEQASAAYAAAAKKLFGEFARVE
jgi:hypothetical protein